MTVAELIEALKAMPQDMQVVSYDADWCGYDKMEAPEVRWMHMVGDEPIRLGAEGDGDSVRVCVFS